MRALPNLAAVVLLLLVAACGTKGDLVQPPGPPPKPILDEWVSPAKKAEPAKAADTAKDSKAAEGKGETKQ